MKKIISSTLALFLFANLSLLGETILLKSGDKLEGMIVAQDKESVTFKLADGTTKVFPKSAIRKISFGKIVEPSSVSKEPPVSEKEKKIKEEKDLSEKRKQEEEKLKSKEEKLKKRDEQLSKSKRHYLEGSFGVGGGESQTELRPFFQTIQYAGLLFGGGGQTEIQSTPYKSRNNSSTTRLFYAWNRFTFEVRGTEAKGNLDVAGFQTLSFGGGSGSSSATEKTTNLLFGNGTTKFQKVSTRVGFTPYPHPVFDLQVIGGIERIWTKTSQEVDSIGGITSTGINPNRVSYRETSNHFKGYSVGLGFEWKFLERFTLQGQILRLEMQGPSSFRSDEFRSESSVPVKYNQFGLDYRWKSTGTELNLKLSAKVKGDWSLFVEASNMTLKNTLQSGYITENDGGGNSDPSQILLKVFAPQILIPILLDSKTVLTYVQVGANYRFNF
ncbi:hypothetical protein JWG45_13960 [Leptospira sp. 201903070]|uniref:Porin n=1 Tax=Leptospira ainlahdjerensis TaxID=2810033 RepID=A0ABS2UFD2_9LEPT|nr:hypothetical protein [Leptospira ainlahdjerensis]MBM9578258.1 hypothetical protein [Leptospira ainlahdjerensis]